MLLRSARGNGYARMTSAGVDVYLTPTEGGLLFIDLGFQHERWDEVIAALRYIPPSLLAASSAVVFRSPVINWTGDIEGVDPDDVGRRVSTRPNWPVGVDELAGRIEEGLTNHRLRSHRLGVFELPIGAAAERSGSIDGHDLATCRSVETEAFLLRHAAIWQPSEYHYRLPSGRHASSFVRIADALRDPAAPEAFASWLRGHLTPSTSVVVDTGSLMPIIGSLDLLVRRAALRLQIPDGLLGIEAIDRYPTTRFEFTRRFGRFEAIEVLALLSVSSSGKTYRLLGESLDETAATWRAACMVSRDQDEPVELPDPMIDRKHQPWLSIESLEDDVEPSKCEYCRSPRRARVVHIDPRTFAAMALPAPKLVMPEYASAVRNASLFEAYRPGQMTSVLLAASEVSRPRAEPRLRRNEPARIRFEPTTLLVDLDQLHATVATRMAQLRSLSIHDKSRRDIERALEKLADAEPTIAVLDGEEVRVLTEAMIPPDGTMPDQVAAVKADMAIERFRTLAATVCDSVVDVVVARKGDAGELAEGLQGHTNPLIVAAGLQTGVTLQHLMVRVQDVFRDRVEEPTVSGLVLHAHPIDAEAWSSVRNSFGGRSNPNLLALWLTYLPGRSPLTDERDTLQKLPDPLLDRARAGVRALVQRRLQWLDEGDAENPPPSPFWFPEQVTLRRTSIYGALDDRQVLPAVGAAMAEALQRADPGGAPAWVSIDVPNALRSYFDAILLASVLRWMTPERAWWGETNVCEALLAELPQRFEGTPDWQVMLPELLLAAAQGKVPDEGVRQLRAEAEARLREDDPQHKWPDAVLDYVDLAARLVEHLWRDPDVPEAAPAARRARPA